jgi:hypothetical protein
MAHAGLDKSVVHFAVSAKKDMLARLVQSTAAMKLPAAPNKSGTIGPGVRAAHS